MAPMHFGGDAIRVELFGGPKVYRRSDGLVGMSPFQLALVTVVYGHHPHPVSRGRASSLLWGSEADPRARQRLRQLLVEIRSRCDGLIETTGKDLRAPESATCDLFAFEQALASGALLDAAAFAGVDFACAQLAGVDDAYLEWRDSLQVGLLRRLRGRARATWSRAAEQGEWTRARDAAEALYRLDPLALDVVERVIEARGRSGDVESAEQAYAACLESAHGSLPGSLNEVIRRVRQAGSGPASAWRMDDLVGRRDALDSARSLYDHINDGRFGVVLIAGESGIGKTRLLQELERDARFRDYRCLSARPVELESRIPLNPLIDALRGLDLSPHLDALGPPWSAVIGAVLPPGTLASPAAELPHIQERALPRRLLDAFSLLLQRLSREQPTVLFIDDLHWADTTTITALQFIQRRWAGGPFGVMATVRTDLVRPEEPVAKYLSKAEGLIHSRVELQELPLEDGMELVRRLSGGRVDDARCRRICALAGLHPLCLIELTKDHLNGRLTLPDTSNEGMVIPVSLEQIVGGRLERLDSRSRRVADVLAVGARPMRTLTLAALTGMSLEDVADTIEVLRRARLVEVEHDKVKIVHELFRSAIYRDLGEPRRSLHHRAIAEHMQSAQGEDSVGELAIHYDRAGECGLAAKYGWVAADRAMETGTVAEAGHFYQLAAKNEGDPVRRAQANSGHASALHLARDIGRANPMLELAASQLRLVGRPTEALRLEIKRIEGLAETGTIPITVLTDTLAGLKQQAAECSNWEAVAQALDVELHLLHRAGNVPGIQRVFGEMRDVATKDSLEATILANAGLALGVLFADPKQALAAAHRAVELAVDGHRYRLIALIRLLLVLHYQGQLVSPLAESIAREAQLLAERSGDVLLRFSIESNLAVGWLDAGYLDRAEALMARAAAIPGAAQMDLNRSIEANNRGELALALGDFGAAAAAYTAAERFLGPTTPSYLRDLVTAGLGICALERGDLAEARRREQELHETPARWCFDPTTILTFRTRVLDRRGLNEAAASLLEAALADLEDRLVLAWLKVRALQVRHMLKHRLPEVAPIAMAASERAQALRLSHRAAEFADLAKRAR